MTYTLFIGLERDSDGNKMDPKKTAEITLDAEYDTAHTFGGYSAIPVYGGWVDPDTNTLVKEKSLRFEVIGSDVPRDKVLDWARYLKFRFKQSSVLLVETESISTFV